VEVRFFNLTSVPASAPNVTRSVSETERRSTSPPRSALAYNAQRKTAKLLEAVCCDSSGTNAAQYTWISPFFAAR